jgi:hypothetical protein
MMQGHRHLPLDGNQKQIRLVQLLPTDDDQVHIKLLVCGLAEVAFDALSYTWGNSSADFTIVCEGQPLEVGRNLFLCLLSLLNCSQTRPLWIDAISIDQANVAERNHAVSQMPLIYHTARRTLCWTGCESGTIDSLSTILDVGYHQRSLDECLSGPDILHSTCKVVENDLNRFEQAAEEIDSHVWSNMDAFLDQTYFNRYTQFLFESGYVADMMHVGSG